MSDLTQEIVDVHRLGRNGNDHRNFGYLTFPPGATVGQVPCIECTGTGWWGYGPTAAECGPCVDCKGTGREWVGLL